MSCRVSRGRDRGYRGKQALFFPAVALSVLVAVSGCGGVDFAALRPGLELRGHYIEGVPFYRQSEQTCGPAALAGVLAYWGRPADLQRITSAVYLPKLRGTLPMDMENFARKEGFRTAIPEGALDSLKAYVKQDVPVICLLDLGFSLYQRPHYITVIGFDDERAVLIVHDGRKPNNVISRETFSKEWVRAGNWMLVITPQTSDVKP